MATNVSFQCTVITPERQVLDTEATFLVFPAHDGEIGVLRNRAPLVCELGAGVLRIEAAKNSRVFIDGGFAQVLKNQVTVLAERAVPVEEIDIERTRAALAEAQARKPERLAEVEARQREIQALSAKLKAATRS